MEELPLIALLVGAGFFVARRLLGSSKEEHARLDRAWAGAAQRLGAQAHLEPGSPWRTAVRRLEGEFEGAAFVIDTFRDGRAERNHVDQTRLRTRGLAGLCPADVRVWPRGAIAKLARRLGLGETPTGDEAFDAAFRVTSVPPGVGRELLDGRTRRLLLELGEGFEIEGRTLTILRSGVPSEAEPLVAMGRFAEAIVQRWVDAGRAPARTARALELAGPAPIVELAAEGATRVASGLRRGRELEVSVLAAGPRLTTIVSCAVGGGAPFALARSPGGWAAEGDAPAYARSIADAAPPGLARLVGEAGRVALELTGLSHDEDELARLVDGLLEATRGGGAYR